MQTESVKSLLWPLSEFWTNERAWPEVERVEAAEIPAPYRRLLVHDRDMTPVLESYWGSELHLEVLARAEARGELFRHVILRTKEAKAASFGAIRIRLGAFPPEAAKAISEGRVPLGAILRDYRIEHRSAPTGFFRMAANALTRQAFGPADTAVHYGRHNELLAPQGLLAEVVEVLPRLEPEDGQGTCS